MLDPPASAIAQRAPFSGLANENPAERSLGWRGGQEGGQDFKRKALASLQALKFRLAGDRFGIGDASEFGRLSASDTASGSGRLLS